MLGSEWGKGLKSPLLRCEGVRQWTSWQKPRRHVYKVICNRRDGKTRSLHFGPSRTICYCTYVARTAKGGHHMHFGYG